MRNPRDDKVHNYRVLENALHLTVKSALGQTYQETYVVVVCQKVPPWSSSYSNHLKFIDVSNSSVFSPNPNTTVDKFFRWAIGSLYAIKELNPGYIMLIDADDYVHNTLASRVMNLKLPSSKDFFMIDKGLNVSLYKRSNGDLELERAFVVDRFDKTCGSCRVFETYKLIATLKKINSNICNKFSEMFRIKHENIIDVSPEPIAWLDSVTTGDKRAVGSLLDTFGRHTHQERHFSYEYLNFVAAAKGCGHGNHSGHREGSVHWKCVIGRMPIQKFMADYSLIGERACKKGLQLLLLDIRYLVFRLVNPFMNPIRRLMRRLKA